jgi:hypothetical protein
MLTVIVIVVSSEIILFNFGGGLSGDERANLRPAAIGGDGARTHAIGVG